GGAYLDARTPFTSYRDFSAARLVEPLRVAHEAFHRGRPVAARDQDPALQRLAAYSTTCTGQHARRPTLGRCTAQHALTFGISRERRAVEAGLGKDQFGRHRRACAIVHEIMSVSNVAQDQRSLTSGEVKGTAADNAPQLECRGQKGMHQIIYSASCGSCSQNGTAKSA